jgi:hypothetical protein
MAARSLGQLIVELQAETSKLKADLAKAEKTLQRTSRRMRKTNTGITNSFKALVPAVTLTALAALSRSAIASTDSLAKLSRQTGLGVEALQKYRFAAEQSGVSTSQFNQAIGAFGKRLGELRAGTGGLFTILNKTDSAFLQQLRTTKDVDSGFRLLIEKVSSMTNQQDKMALSAAAFSRGPGIAMVNAAQQGTAAFDALGKQLESVGGVISEETAVKAEGLADKMNLLSKSWDNLIAIIAVNTPVIEVVTTLFTDMAKAVQILTKENDPLQQEIDETRAHIEALKGQISTKGGVLGVFNEDINTLEQKLVTANIKLKQLIETQATHARAMANERGILADNIRLNKEQGIIYGKVGDAAGEKNKKIDAQAEALRKEGERVAEVHRMYDALYKSGFRTRFLGDDDLIADKTGGVIDDLTEANERLEEMAALGGEFVNALREVDQELQAVNGELENSIDLSDEWKITWEEILRDTISGVRQGFADLFEGYLHGKALDSVGSFLDSIKDMFLRTIAEIAAAWATAKIFGGSFSLGNLVISGGGGGGGILGATLGSIFGGAAGSGLPGGVSSAAYTATIAGKTGGVGALPAAGGASSAGAAGGLATASAAVPYVMAAIAAYDILTATSVPVPDQIKNALASGNNALTRDNTGLVGMVNAGLGFVGASEQERQFTEFASARGASVVSTDQGARIATGRYYGDREAESVADIVDAFRELQELMPEIQAAGVEAFSAIGVTASELETALMDGVVGPVELAELGLASMGGTAGLTAEQFGAISEAVNNGTLSMEALTGQTNLTRAEFEILREAGILTMEQWRDASGILRLDLMETEEAATRFGEEMQEAGALGVAAFTRVAKAAGAMGDQMGDATGEVKALGAAILALPSLPAGGVPSVPAPSFHTGGLAVVPGSGNTDRPFAVNLTPGEVLQVHKKGTGPGAGADGALMDRLDRLLAFLEAA